MCTRHTHSEQVSAGRENAMKEGDRLGRADRAGVSEEVTGAEA